MLAATAFAGCSGDDDNGGDDGGDDGGGDTGGGDTGGGDTGGSDDGGDDSSMDPHTQDLVEAARNESGTFSWYHSAPTSAGAAVLAAFQTEYPDAVDGVENVRGPSSSTIQRFEAEFDQGDLNVNHIHHTDLSWFATAAEDRGILVEYESPENENFPSEPWTTQWWAPIRMFTMPWTFNTNAVTKSELPTSWQGLVDYSVENHAGSIGWGAADGGGVALMDMWRMDKEFGDEAWDWLAQVAETDASYYTSHGAMTNDTVSGAIEISQNQLSYRIQEFGAQGAPVGGIWPDEGATVQPAPGSIPTEDAGNDMVNTAKLFQDFLLSAGGQEFIQQEYNGYSARDPQPINQELLPGLDEFTNLVVDPFEVKGDTQRIIDRFKEVTGR